MTSATLTDLPFELFTEILIESHCPALYAVNRHLNAMMRAASNTVRAHYLLSSWAACESACDAAWAYHKHILDYCLRFPICNDVVLKKLNSWIVDGGPSKVAPESAESAREVCHIFTTPREKRLISSKAFVGVKTLPKRIFKGSGDKASTTYPTGFEPGLTSMVDNSVAEPTDAAWPLRCALSYIASRDRSAILPLEDLVLLLTILSLHPFDREMGQSRVPRSRRRPSPDSLINSHGGYALARATFEKNFGLCSLLLAYGARPEPIVITVACRNDWVEGLQLLLQRNSREERRWDRAQRIIFWWALDRYESDLDPSPSPTLFPWAPDQLTGYKSESEDIYTYDDEINGDVIERPTQAHYQALTERITKRRTEHPNNPHRRRTTVAPSDLKQACKYDAEDVVRYLVDRDDVGTDMAAFQRVVEYLEKKDTARGEKRKREESETE